MSVGSAGVLGKGCLALASGALLKDNPTAVHAINLVRSCAGPPPRTCDLPQRFAAIGRGDGRITFLTVTKSAKSGVRERRETDASKKINQAALVATYPSRFPIGIGPAHTPRLTPNEAVIYRPSIV